MMMTTSSPVFNTSTGSFLPVLETLPEYDDEGEEKGNQEEAADYAGCYYQALGWSADLKVGNWDGGGGRAEA